MSPFDQVQSIIRENPDTDEIYIRDELYFDVLVELEKREARMMPLPPEPPMRKKTTRIGFFSSEVSIEVDHHAPKYLQELKEYEREMEFWWEKQRRKREVEFVGPKTTVKIKPASRLKGNNEC